LRAPELPEINQWDERIIHHYFNLQTERPTSGMGGMYPLRWSSIHEYAVLHGFVGEEHDWFVSIIRRIDQAMREDADNEQQRLRQRAQSKTSSGGRRR